MSRPSSSGKKGKKGSAKTPKKQIAELTEQNNLLMKEISGLNQENDTLKLKVETMINKMFETLQRKDFGLKDGVNIFDIPLDIIIQMLNKLIAKKILREMSVEARVEELEARVTDLNFEIAKLTKKTVAYECGLQDLIKYYNIDEIKDKVYQLQLIAGQEYHFFTSHDNLAGNGTSTTLINIGIDEPADTYTKNSIETAIKLNLMPPAKRLPGDIHVDNMNRDLRLYVVKELSYTKSSGADWRMFAKRVGIDPEAIEYWTLQKLDCPMGRVMAAWCEKKSATVRQLHRHLMSPQLRATILAKRVSDFYEVD